MGPRMRELLELLSDELWHTEIPRSIRPATVDACVRYGLARLGRHVLKRTGDLETYRIKVCITARGKREFAAWRKFTSAFRA